ncbi:elicitor [Pseudomassariella vexata]|uniref:Elicitor n=1 Tax=Pseudomassariella vexata TaxID=1141098 RepID=A0A1Y2E168_9PEZI|nr:elicitor [Pseudomassariella vexata]ORY65278.1 elicitor [Pseudomassariella vexata]
MRASKIVAALAAGLGVSAAPIAARAVISHDAVVGFAETVPSGTLGSAYLKFKPWLKVVNGCVPFPAVDTAGNTGGGLDITGASNGDCDSSTGQVYVRSTAVGSSYAFMYSWYMPKDSPSSGLGHRHDWESIVVWTDTSYSTILGVATSAHGEYATTTSPPLDGTRAKIQYYSTWPTNHQLGTTDTKGGEQPLIAWESMTDAARTVLTNTDFGSANVPFKDANFQNNLALAAL